MHIHSKTYLKCLGIALLLCCTGTALAVDGVIEINQVRAMAGGVTAGDAPGFPVTLDQPGSYRLTGNLTLPDENTTGIDITANDVTVDLNGFGIFGVVVCVGDPVVCLPAGGTGDGIHAEYAVAGGATINGTIRGMGNAGILRLGFNGRVQWVNASSNGQYGIVATGNLSNNTAGFNGSIGIVASLPSTVSGNTVSFNAGTGIIAVVDGHTVSGNTVVRNGGNGIQVQGTVSGNTVRGNGGDGIVASSGTEVRGNAVFANTGFGLSSSTGAHGVYTDNMFTDNNGGNANPQVVDAIEMGTNFCGTDTTCP